MEDSMTAADKNRALDRNETEWVEMSRAAAHLTDAQLTDLLRRLRERRDRAQRMIRTRTRKASREGQANIDTGAREKKAQLAEAIQRAADEQKRRRSSTSATRNLKAAVARKAEQTHDGIPENRTPNTGPAETPNDKIAPSGALHAEGMRAAITRSTGDR